MKHIFLFILIQLPYLAISQIKSILPSNILVEFSQVVSNKKPIPFGILSQKYGLISANEYNTIARINIQKDHDTTKKLDLSYGIDLVDRYTAQNQLFFHQLHAGINYRFLSLYIGQKEELYGNQDSILSMGGAIWSKNAPPIPKIMLQTNRYVIIPYTNNWLAFNTGIAHGWFGNDGFVKKTLLHQKYFYLRLGKNENFYFYAGIQHYAQWAGTSPIYGELPNGFKNFVRVFFAQDNNGKIDPGTSGIPSNDAFNRIGNHLGTKDFAFDIRLQQNLKIKLYWQNFIEDITGMGFRNAMDGLWGLSIIHKKWRINTEYIHTYTITTSPSSIDSLDNYFNNVIYHSGWTYKGYVLGIPLITSPVQLSDTLIGKALINNRIKGIHFSFFVNTKWFDLLAHYIYTQNYGGTQFYWENPLKQNSVWLSVSRNHFLIDRLMVQFSLAIDHGKLLKNNSGLGFTIKYTLKHL